MEVDGDGGVDGRCSVVKGGVDERVERKMNEREERKMKEKTEVDSQRRE